MIVGGEIAYDSLTSIVGGEIVYNSLTSIVGGEIVYNSLTSIVGGVVVYNSLTSIVGGEIALGDISVWQSCNEPFDYQKFSFFDLVHLSCIFWTLNYAPTQAVNVEVHDIVLMAVRANVCVLTLSLWLSGPTSVS